MDPCLFSERCALKCFYLHCSFTFTNTPKYSSDFILPLSGAFPRRVLYTYLDQCYRKLMVMIFDMTLSQKLQPNKELNLMW